MLLLVTRLYVPKGRGTEMVRDKRSRRRRLSTVDMVAASAMTERWTITRLADGTWSIVAICRLG